MLVRDGVGDGRGGGGGGEGGGIEVQMIMMADGAAQAHFSGGRVGEEFISPSQNTSLNLHGSTACSATLGVGDGEGDRWGWDGARESAPHSLFPRRLAFSHPRSHPHTTSAKPVGVVMYAIPSSRCEQWRFPQCIGSAMI